MFVSLFDLNFVISPANVQCHKAGTATKVVDDLAYKQGDIFVFLCPFVQRSIVLNWSELSILLFDEEKVHHIRRFGDLDCSST